MDDLIALAREIVADETEPPWCAVEFDGASDKWGDEQDRSDWFEDEADRLGGQARRLAELVLARLEANDVRT